MRDEYDFQKDVVKYLNKNRIYHMRTQMGATSGYPDIIACYKGFFLGIELKREDGNGRPTEQQLKVQKDIQEANGFSCIISSLLELKRTLGYMDTFIVVNND